MVDVLTPEQRKLNMSRIRGSDTQPEMLIRRGLHARGFRYRLHDKSLPGRPDLVLPKYSTAVFVHGCFWHGHDCPMFRLPATRPEFWSNKIDRTRVRDERSFASLLRQGWRVLTVWECALRGPYRLPLDLVISTCAEFIVTNEPSHDIVGYFARGESSSQI